MQMWRTLYFSLLVSCGLFCSLTLTAQPQVRLSVTADTMQTFLGLGFSIHRAKTSYLPSAPTVFSRLYEESFGSFRHLVFWSYIENPSERDQVIAAATQAGLQGIIVNTTGEPPSPEAHAQTLFLEIHEYQLAGYPIYGTTIMNKPNTDESDTRRQTPAFLATATKLLRAKLDSAGYTHIKIGGPSTVEWAPYLDPTAGGAAHGYSFVPGDNMMYLQGLMADTAAWAALDAIDFQSYGWSIDTTIQQIAEAHGKELWVTLAALDGLNNQNGAVFLSPAIAANCLANLNHGVATWNHWVWDQLINFSTGQPNHRMRYLQQIGQQFERGARFRRVWADSGQVSRDMFWNYYDINNPAQNRQPEVVAAAAMNPDRSLTIAVVNLTGIHAQHFFSTYHPDEAATYTVTLDLAELQDVPLLASEVWLCEMNSGQVLAEPGPGILAGEVSFSLGSGDMLLLRTQPVPATTTSLDPATASPQLTLYPNPHQGPVSLQYHLPSAAQVTVQVLDMTGRMVAYLPRGWQGSGHHTLDWTPPPGLGLYVVRLLAQGAQGTSEAYVRGMHRP